jgi:hypothetical protein
MAYTAIDDPSQYHQSVIYTGNGSSQSITFGGNSDMQPDMLWTKCRDDNFDPIIRDSQRGIANRLLVHATDGHGGATGTTSFDSDGFSIDSTSTVNSNTKLFVGWGWKANGGTETTNQSESGSQIACSVQANTTAGFSIITYTGTGGTGHTFLHGLGAAPGWLLIKRTSGTEDWLVFHHKNTSDPATDHLLLNTNDATSDSATRFDDTAPNGTEVACGNNAVINGDGSTYVCWAWKEVKGFSKFGQYTGNGSADGPLVYTGFKPAWLMTKRTDSSDHWRIVDNSRNTTNNGALAGIKANQNETESDAGNRNIDFLTNGFKMRDTDVDSNASSGTYVYMAFAEHPFVSSEGVPVTAR